MVVERRIKEARFPTVKSLDSFDFMAIHSLNKTLVLELARCEYIARREKVIAVGNSGTYPWCRNRSAPRQVLLVDFVVDSAPVFRIDTPVTNDGADSWPAKRTQSRNTS
jgi:IstB-like ATP binding protein